MELQIFQNAEFGSVRSTMIGGEPFFVGKDVAEILGYADPNKAIAMHVDEEDKLNDKTASSLGQRGGWLINESGLYGLILSSKLPAAKRFKRWVTSEVLPAIRRHGLYAVDDMLNNPDALIEALQAYKAERLQRMALEAENAVQKQQLIEMQPKASYYDVVLNSPDLVSITEISKDYGDIAELEQKLKAAETVKDDGLSQALGVMKKYSREDELTQAMVQELIEKVAVTDPEHVEIVWKFKDEVRKFIGI